MTFTTGSRCAWLLAIVGATVARAQEPTDVVPTEGTPDTAGSEDQPDPEVEALKRQLAAVQRAAEEATRIAAEARAAAEAAQQAADDARAAATKPPPPPATGYNNGFFIQTPDQESTLRIRGMVQPRFALLARDPDPSTWTASFLVQRAQLELNGTAFTRALGFTLRADFGRAEVFMRDAHLDFKLLPGMLLRGGLFKKPFSRQQLAVDWRLAFLDRSPTDSAFRAGRDLGVGLQSDNTPFEWSVGLFSGTQDKPKVTADVILDDTGASLQNGKVTNVPKLFSPTLVARAGYTFGDLQGLNEMDLAGGPSRFGIAASLLESVDISGKSASATQAQVDAMYKVEHVTATGAVYATLLQNDARSLTAQELDKLGAFAQVGVLLFDRIHPAVRYSVIQELPESTLLQEAVANATILFFEQNVMWGVEVASIVDSAGFELAFRTQAQLVF